MLNKLILSLLLLVQSVTNAQVYTDENPTPAPGRGEITSLKEHYKTKPSFYDFNNMSAEVIAPGIKRRFIMGAQSMLTCWEVKAGTTLPLHFHPNEQISRVEKGLIEAYSQGEKYIIKPGQVMVFPPNVPHEFVALKDSFLIEQFSPARQDFLSGGAGGIPLPPK